MRESAIETHLRERVKKKGGLCVKIPAVHFVGIPDRLVLLPGAVMYFVELKAPGKKPTPKQQSVHEKIRSLGFTVYVIDNKEIIKELVK
jgi:hypothetical protein